MDKKREFPERKKGDNVIAEVVRAEACALYPDNETDEGMLPRSKPESRAGLDCNNHDGKK